MTRIRTTCTNGGESTIHGLRWVDGIATLLPVAFYSDTYSNVYLLCSACADGATELTPVTPDTTITRVSGESHYGVHVTTYADPISRILPDLIPTGAGWTVTATFGEWEATLATSFEGSPIQTYTLTQGKGMPTA